jgi:hypothetical protein
MHLAYEIIIPDSPSRYSTNLRIAEGVAAFHCGKVGERKLVEFNLLVSKFDEDYPVDWDKN